MQQDRVLVVAENLSLSMELIEVVPHWWVEYEYEYFKLTRTHRGTHISRPDCQAKEK